MSGKKLPRKHLLPRPTMIDLGAALGVAILIAALLTHAGLAYLRVVTCAESGLATLTCIL